MRDWPAGVAMERPSHKMLKNLSSL